MIGNTLLSVPFGPLVLTWDDITNQIRSTFEQFIDPRQGKNTRYTLVDAGLSAFAVFFLQSPSFWEDQRRLEQAHGTNNAQTLFGVHQIPSDNQIRYLLDATPASHGKPLFSSLFKALNQAGVIERYRSVNQTVLLALDGTAYFSSQHLHCPNCSTRRHANGQVTYFHHALGYEWVDFWERRGGVNTVVRRRWTGQRREVDTYRYATAIPLRDGDKTLQSNGCELTTTDEQGRVLDHNAFATSLGLDERRVVEVVAAGRRRWQIENDNNNTLKTKGYHFEHHYGHGQQYWSSLLASLILLAFLVHTILETTAEP